MRIVMLLSNGFGPDPRVAAEALALNEVGHQVTIFAWDRSGELPACEDYQGVNVVRSQIRSGYSRGPLQIFKFLDFWRDCRRFLNKLQPDLIHAHDLDTLKVGLDSGKRRRIPVIYDAHESYPDMVAHLFPKPVVGLIRAMERRLLPQTSAVITVGELLVDHFRSGGAKKVVLVGNYKTLTATGPSPSLPMPPLRIIYVGGLNRDRLLGPMIKALKGNPLYQLLVVGAGPELDSLVCLADQAENIEFTGFLPQAEARKLIDSSHLLYYGIDGSYPNNYYSAPNSLFMALAAGRPVICNNVGEIARIIREQACGTVLADLEPETILTALEPYHRSEIWWQQSQAGFRVATKKYNWNQAKANLQGLYRELELINETT